jgi:hypothetical protein
MWGFKAKHPPPLTPLESCMMKVIDLIHIH